MGTQNALTDAQDFRARNGVETLRLLWDDSFDSWEHFEVTSQPAAVLLDPKDGSVIERWQGELDQERLDEILRLAADL